MQFMKWVLNYWLWFAVLFSLIWGIYGNIEVIEQEGREDAGGNNKYKVKNAKKKHIGITIIKTIGFFFSEFIGSFAGWFCLYIIFIRLQLPDSYSKMGSVDVFLIIGAFVGMAGHSFQIINSIADVIKNMKPRSKNASE